MKKQGLIICAAACAVGLAAGIAVGSIVLKNGSADPKTAADKTNGTEITFTVPEIPAHSAETFEAEDVPAPEIVTASFFGDAEKAYTLLSKLKDSGAGANASTLKSVTDAEAAFCAFSRYLEYKDSISVTIGDTVYGAYCPEGYPAIGGGAGYDRIITSGDYTVRTYDELVDACAKAKSGEVIFIPSDAVISVDKNNKGDRTHHFMLGEGVTLASDRGYVREDGSVSTGAIIKGDGYGAYLATSFISCASSSRITGLVIQGPDPMRHVNHHTRAFYGVNGVEAKGRSYYYAISMPAGIKIRGTNVEIDNCEISAFCNEAIGVEDFDAHVHHNYIHHNQIKGLGYGVCFYHGGAIVESNMFDFNRHSIAGVGYGDSWYIARYNVDMGDVLDHVYDMHGGADRGDGTNIAGKFVEMYNNTFLTDDRPYHVRGVPVEKQTFYHNILFHPVSQYNLNVLRGARTTISDNIFGIGTENVVK